MAAIAQEEDAVEEQYGVCGGGRGQRGRWSVGVSVVDRVLEPSVSAWAQRIEQDPAQRGVVVTDLIASASRLMSSPRAPWPIAASLTASLLSTARQAIVRVDGPHAVVLDHVLPFAARTTRISPNSPAVSDTGPTVSSLHVSTLINT
ncbi:hypothetical protein Pmi06nite_69550 [Planotetraspora mira]|uniref:Uncharacterized protein n=1 Tax=Planotetraspora mira TaxID=58121 RepID=A0A8J3XEH9_9ACTN|nr:hypothetical protein Pmi06nite_69550 [Planotetraspora mira]